QQVAACQQDVFHARGAVLLVAGDVTADEARAALDAEFGQWAAGRAGDAAPSPAPAPAATQRREPPPLRVVLVRRPHAAPTYADPSRMRRQVLSQILGGTFTSRLNQNLREQHGYTYGVGAGFDLGPFCGWFSTRTSVETPVTGASIKELLGEFARLRGSS